MAIINSTPCEQPYRKIPLSENKPASVETINKNFDLIERGFNQLRQCVARKIESAFSGPGVTPTPLITSKRGPRGMDGEDGEDGESGLDGSNGRDGKRGPRGLDGEDGEDGEPGLDGKDGVTAQTYFDLELSYGREDGVGTLAAYGTGSEGTPNFYLRPNTDLNVLTFATGGAPGEVWEYEVTRELLGTLILDLCVYQCLITPQPETTAIITASVTKNTTGILPSPNLDGITYSPSGTRVVVTLPGAHYLPGERIGVHVETTNFSSGVLHMTAHVSCEEKLVAAGAPAGPQGIPGVSIQGPPGVSGEDAQQNEWFPFPGKAGADGLTGSTGKTGPPGPPPGDVDTVQESAIIPPPSGRPSMIGILKWSGSQAFSTSQAFLSDGLVFGTALFYGLPVCILKNFRITWVFTGASISTNVQVFSGGSSLFTISTATGSGSFTDLTHTATFNGSQNVDVMAVSTSNGTEGQFWQVSVTAELWTQN